MHITHRLLKLLDMMHFCYYLLIHNLLFLNLLKVGVLRKMTEPNNISHFLGVDSINYSLGLYANFVEYVQVDAGAYLRLLVLCIKQQSLFYFFPIIALSLEFWPIIIKSRSLIKVLHVSILLSSRKIQMIGLQPRSYITRT